MKKPSLVSEYLNEVVYFGGVRMPRHQMIAELTEIAKATGRSNWKRLVGIYLLAHGRKT